MSLLPLGNRSADGPAREYQTRLNRGRKIPEANSELVAAGLFKEFWGPAGGCPVQLQGILHNDEFVYFRARGTKVELEVSAQLDGEPHARYRKKLVVSNHELGTGVLPVPICVAYIKRWLSDYLSRCQPRTRFAGESFTVEEAEESISI